MPFLYACPGISPQRRRASSSQTSYRSLSVQARKVRSFRCSSSPQKVFRLFGDPRVSSSSHSHIPIGRLFSCQRTNIPSLITSGKGYFFGCFEKIFFILSLVPTGKGNLLHPFSKNISSLVLPFWKPKLCPDFLSSYIGLLKKPPKINPLRKTFLSTSVPLFFRLEIKPDFENNFSLHLISKSGGVFFRIYAKLFLRNKKVLSVSCGKDCHHKSCDWRKTKTPHEK